MIDALTVQKLVFTGQNNNAELRASIESMGNRPRFLDKAPDKFVFMSKGMDFEPFGVHQQFKRLYEEYTKSREDKECTIVIDERRIPCDFKVYVALRVLLDVGVSKSEECAMACRDVFESILSRESEDGIRACNIYGALKSGSNYYRNEISEAIIDCVYTKSEQVDIVLRDLLGTEYKYGSSSLLGDPKDVEELMKMINDTYKKASRDPDFKIKKRAGKAVNAIRYLRGDNA